MVGRTVFLDGRPTVVAGVLPPGAAFPEGAELWTPLPEDRWERDDKEIAAVARLALAALALAAAGVYGLMAFAVTRRRREIGIRMALGARPGRVVAMVARDGAALVAAGAVLGLAGAAALARSLEGLLYRTAASDATTYAATVAVLAAVGLLASYLPARRAAAIDPTVTLTAE